MKRRGEIINLPEDGRVRDDERSDVVDLTRYETADGQGAFEEAFEAGGVDFEKYRRRISLLLVGIDAACLVVALVAARVVRFDDFIEREYLTGMAVAVVLWVAVFAALGLYAAHQLSALEEFRRTVSAAGLGIVVVILVSFWLDVYLSRSWMALTLIIALVLELAGRRFVHVYQRRLRARGLLVVRTLVVGTTQQALELIDALAAPGSGFLTLGYVDAIDPRIAADDVPPAERVERLRAILREHRPNCLFIASPTIGERQMAALVQAARKERVLVRVFTHLSGVLTSRLTVQPVGKDGVALTLKPAGLSGPQRILKRTIDAAAASSGLIVTAPVLVLIAAAIKLTSKGPILFRQERVTERGRIFSMYKFRTMADGAERAARESSIDTSVPFFKLKSDPRLTTVGRWLRKWSLDELPQLANVLVGDMSLVGPRPLPADQVAANVELLGPRHEVRAGLTGWWQVRGRADVAPEEAIRMDHFYIENWSLTLDLYILLKTVEVLLRGKGAY